MSDRLNIANEMRMFDRKVRSFYNDLTAEEKKKFSNYLMIRWGSSVEAKDHPKGDLIEQYYLQNCNENFNKHFFSVSKHPQLQWLMATTVSPGAGTFRHTWVAPRKKEAGLSAKRRALVAMYPDYKDDEIDVMCAITTQKEIDEYNKQAGNEKK
jgi:hypothetical protein